MIGTDYYENQRDYIVTESSKDNNIPEPSMERRFGIRKFMLFSSAVLLAVTLSIAFFLNSLIGEKQEHLAAIPQIEDEALVFEAYENAAGEAFVAGKITHAPDGNEEVIFHDWIKGEYAYLKLVFQVYEWDEGSEEYEWETDYTESDTVSGTVMFGQIEVDASELEAYERLNLTQDMVTAGNWVEPGGYLSINSYRRCAVYAVEFDEDHSALVNFDGGEVENLVLSRGSVQELYEAYVTSKGSLRVTLWLVWGFVTLFIWSILWAVARGIRRGRDRGYFGGGHPGVTFNEYSTMAHDTGTGL